MLSVGLDLHKKYSQLEVIDEAGVRRAGARLPNELDQVAGFFGPLVNLAEWCWRLGGTGDRCATGPRRSRTSWKCSWRTRMEYGRSRRHRSRRIGSTREC